VTAVEAPRIPVLPTPTGVGGEQPQTSPGPPAAVAAPVVAPVTTRVPSIAIDVPCVAVSAARRERAEFELRGRRARISFRAPARSRFAKFTLRRARGNRRDIPIVETLGYARVRSTGLHTSAVALTGGQRRLVRAGAMRLAVAYGTCRTQVGRWQWITSDREGRR
jgi:hypothetical protein